MRHGRRVRPPPRPDHRHGRASPRRRSPQGNIRRGDRFLHNSLPSAPSSHWIPAARFLHPPTAPDALPSAPSSPWTRSGKHVPHIDRALPPTHRHRHPPSRLTSLPPPTAQSDLIAVRRPPIQSSSAAAQLGGRISLALPRPLVSRSDRGHSSGMAAGMRKAPSMEWRWVSAGEEDDDKLEGRRAGGPAAVGAAASSRRTRRTTSTTRTRSTGRPGSA